MRIETAGGPAKVVLTRVAGPSFLLVLTHGAGGDVDAKDLAAVRETALRLGGTVALVTQPFRVAGRRAPGSAPAQDAAWLDILAALRKRRTLAKIPLIQGGRSNGARVACRTAAASGARGVIALAFPLHPPGKPANSRVDELRAAQEAGVEVLVINGERDPFGIPDPADATHLQIIPGEAHSFRAGFAEIHDAVWPWLERWRG
jgi:predicted alpha/beta-hydrolase family hydrolase